MNEKANLAITVQGYIDTLTAQMDVEVDYLTTIAGKTGDASALEEATKMQEGYANVKSHYGLSTSSSICMKTITWKFEQVADTVLKRDTDDTDDTTTTASVCSLKTVTATTTTTSAATAASSDFWIYSYSDTTCDSDDESTSAEGFGSESLGCIPWTGEQKGMKAKFDSSLWEVTVYSGESCDSSDLLYTLESETCYDISATGDEGSYKVAKATKDFTIYTYADSTTCDGDATVETGSGTASLGCVTFTGSLDGFKAVFDGSLYKVTVHKGESCDSSNVLDTVTSGTCYDTSATDGKGAYNIVLA
ncbi:hypothetical protein N7528_010078 [Penicillium herquei]|nr:hypothetical protein N7528_010078 [Penicillium herquei]